MTVASYPLILPISQPSAQAIHHSTDRLQLHRTALHTAQCFPFIIYVIKKLKSARM